MKQNELKIGDRVKIKSSSQYYRGNSLSNPKDIEGVIYKTKSTSIMLHINVRWDNNYTNSYRNSDLELIAEQPEYKILSYQSCKVSSVIFKLDEERNQYFSGNIFLRPENIPNQNIHSVMNKDGNTFDIGDEITLIEGVNKGNKFNITGFRMKKDGSTVCAITNTHTPYGVGINKIEHYVEKEPEFVLPEKWCIKTEKASKDSEIIGNWFNNQSKNNCYNSCLGMYYHSHNSINQNILTKGNLFASFADYVKRNTYIEITFEQFKKYVLKEEVKLDSFSGAPVIIAQGHVDQLRLSEQGIKSIVIPNETLLEKAKRLYPIGTKFINPVDNKECVIKNEGYHFEGNTNNIYHSLSYGQLEYSEGLSGCIYTEGRWAEIIEEVGPKVGDKFQIYTQPYTTFERRMSEYVHTIEKFEGSLRNPNSVISFTGNYPGAKTQTVLLKNVKFIKDE